MTLQQWTNSMHQDLQLNYVSGGRHRVEICAAADFGERLQTCSSLCSSAKFACSCSVISTT